MISTSDEPRGVTVCFTAFLGMHFRKPILLCVAVATKIFVAQADLVANILTLAESSSDLKLLTRRIPE
jgi:hypothetical protein